jgi:hypothetical protein
VVARARRVGRWAVLVLLSVLRAARHRRHRRRRPACSRTIRRGHPPAEAKVVEPTDDQRRVSPKQARSPLKLRIFGYGDARRPARRNDRCPRASEAPARAQPATRGAARRGTSRAAAAAGGAERARVHEPITSRVCSRRASACHRSGSSSTLGSKRCALSVALGRVPRYRMSAQRFPSLPPPRSVEV